MPAIKTNTAPTSSQRQPPGSETNPNQAMRRLAADTPIQSPLDDAARTAISARTAEHANLVASSPAGTPLPPITDADAASQLAEQISAQIVQQPSTALLTQQRVLADQVLALLRD